MRVGLVGSGVMGRIHAAAWKNTPAQLVGVVSADVESAQALAASSGAGVFDSLAAMLHHVDVVDICTPTYLHHEMVLEVAAAGKHVICEKPLGRSREQAQEMVAACEAAGVKLLVAQVVRFFPEYARAKSIVDSGDIGRVGVMRLTRCSFKPSYDNPASWFHDEEKSGGMILDLMIHDFDYARWVSGEVETVYARHVADRFPDAPGDYALVMLRHANGAITHVEGGWIYPVPMFRTALEIAGEHGLIEHPAGSSTPISVHLHEAATSDAKIAIPRNPLAEDAYTTQIKHFYQVLTDDSVTPRVTAADGAAAVDIALAAIESARTGRAIRLRGVG